MAKSGKSLFFVRGLYIYSIIAIGTLIVWKTGMAGPFADDATNDLWFWVSLGVAGAGAFVRVITSGFAALGGAGLEVEHGYAGDSGAVKIEVESNFKI